MAALTAELAKRGVHVVLATVWRFVKRASHALGMNQKAVVPGCEGRPEPAQSPTGRHLRRQTITFSVRDPIHDAGVKLVFRPPNGQDHLRG